MCEVLTANRMPWEVSWNGHTWLDMPGQYAEDKLLNFALYRRGKLDLEMDGETRKLRVVPVVRHGDCKGLAVGAAYRQAARREKREEAMREAREAEERDQVFRASVRLRLAEWKERHVSSMMQIAERAKLNRHNLCAFVRNGHKLGTDALQRAAAVMDDLDSGAVVLRDSLRGLVRRKPSVVPEGHQPFKAWLSEQAARRGMMPHTLYVFLKRHPEQMPPIKKIHARAWFVKIGTEVAA